MKKVLFSVLTIASLFVLMVSPGWAQTDFFDNFESYTVGSDINGQGGWSTGNPVVVGNRAGAPGGGNHMDGAWNNTGLTAQVSGPRRYYDLAIVPQGVGTVVTLRAELYARSSQAGDGPRTHNSAVGFNGYSLGIQTNTNTGATVWNVDMRSVGGGVVTVPGWDDAALFDTVVEVEMAIDIDNAEIATSIGGISGGTELVDQGLLLGLSEVGQIIDYRGTAGFEIHSISVTIPEPGSLTLLFMGLAGLGLIRIRCRRRS